MPTKDDLLENIKEISKSLEDIIDKISKRIIIDVEEPLWTTRAEIEMLVVKLKIFLKKDDEMERWQKSFLSDLKGTKSIPKAIKILEETIMNQTDTINISANNLSESYKYFWKLKETISSVLSAFEVKRVSKSSSSENSEVFEI